MTDREVCKTVGSATLVRTLQPPYSGGYVILKMISPGGQEERCCNLKALDVAEPAPAPPFSRWLRGFPPEIRTAIDRLRAPIGRPGTPNSGLI